MNKLTLDKQKEMLEQAKKIIKEVKADNTTTLV